jgi:hypothetical protein
MIEHQLKYSMQMEILLSYTDASLSLYFILLTAHSHPLQLLYSDQNHAFMLHNRINTLEYFMCLILAIIFLYTIVIFMLQNKLLVIDYTGLHIWHQGYYLNVTKIGSHYNCPFPKTAQEIIHKKIYSFPFIRGSHANILNDHPHVQTSEIHVTTYPLSFSCPDHINHTCAEPRETTKPK